MHTYPRRIDCFTELVGTAAFGEKLREQVEERLRFYEEGVAPSKNTTAMQARGSSASRIPCLAIHHTHLCLPADTVACMTCTCSAREAFSLETCSHRFPRPIWSAFPCLS